MGVRILSGKMVNRNVWGAGLLGVGFLLFVVAYFSPWMLVSLESTKVTLPQDVFVVPSSRILDFSLLLVMFALPVHLYLARTPISKMWSYSSVLITVLLALTRERWALLKLTSPLVTSRTVVPKAGYYLFLLSVLAVVLAVAVFEGECRWSYLLPTDEEIKREFGLINEEEEGEGEEEPVSSPSSSEPSKFSPTSPYSPALPSQYPENREERDGL